MLQESSAWLLKIKKVHLLLLGALLFGFTFLALTQSVHAAVNPAPAIPGMPGGSEANNFNNYILPCVSNGTQGNKYSDFIQGEGLKTLSPTQFELTSTNNQVSLNFLMHAYACSSFGAGQRGPAIYRGFTTVNGVSQDFDVHCWSSWNRGQGSGWCSVAQRVITLTKGDNPVTMSLKPTTCVIGATGGQDAACSNGTLSPTTNISTYSATIAYYPLEGTIDDLNCTFDNKTPPTSNQGDNTGLIRGWAYDTKDTNYKMDIIVRAGKTVEGGGDNVNNPRVSVTKADGARPGESYGGVSINGHGFSITTLNQQGGKSIRDYILENGFDTEAGKALYFTVSARAADGRTQHVPFGNPPSVRTLVTCPGLDGKLEDANCTFTPTGLPPGSPATGVLQGWAIDRGDASKKVQIIVRAGKFESGPKAGDDAVNNPRVSEGTYADKTIIPPGGGPRPDSFAGVPLAGHEYQITNLNLQGNKSIREYVVENGGELFFTVFARDSSRTRQLAPRVKITCSPACSITMEVPGRPANDRTPEPGQQFTVSAEYPSAFPLSTQVVINIVRGTRTKDQIQTPPDAPLESVGLRSISLSPNARKFGDPPNPPDSPVTFTIPSVGEYTVRVRFSNAAGAVAFCSEPFEVASKPYLRVYGNDIAVGSKFIKNDDPEDNCNIASLPNNKASILAFANPAALKPTAPWSGASSQLAAFALGEIYEFTSAGMQASPGSSSPPKGLTIGNYYNPAAEYGGLGGQYRCMPDYFNILHDKLGDGVSSTSVSATGAGTYKPSGGVGEMPAGTVSGQGNVALVEGDLFISGNVDYASFTSSTAPSLYVVVKGDIYISPSVTRLSGVFIAQGGTIYTCANKGTFVPKAELYTTCDDQLVINGAFVAQDVKFLRTKGTLSAATASEASSSDNIAEVFKSGGSLYMAAPVQLQKPVSSSRTYDSITSLPPVL